MGLQLVCSRRTRPFVLTKYCLTEIENIGIVIENKVCSVAIASKEVENPCLLFGVKHLFAMHIAIVRAVSAKKLLDLLSQRDIVLTFHLAE